MPIRERSVFDSEFLDTVQRWFAARNDIFAVARYSHMAGAKDYFWFRDFDPFQAQLGRLPSQTDLHVFRDDQFPLRGTVDDELIRQTLELIPDNSEAMVTDMVEPPDASVYIWQPETHAEMLETLQDLVGEQVAVGLYAPWHRADSEIMISALVPLADGTLKRGVY